MKYFLSTLSFIFLTLAVSAQGVSLKKGSKVFIETTGDERAKEVKNELLQQIRDWGYWTVVSSKPEANFIMDLNVNTHRGMTAWSWGGVTVRASVLLRDKSGEIIWQSREYKSNPNGSNGFNTAKATITKIVDKELKKKFR